MSQGKLETPKEFPSVEVHQPPSSHHAEFLEPASAEKHVQQRNTVLEAMLESSVSRLEAKLDLLLAESRATRPNPGVGSEELGVFKPRRKQKGGKKMLHPEAFRSMYMNINRQISMMELPGSAPESPDTWCDFQLFFWYLRF